MPIFHPFGSIEIPHIIQDEELINIFNKCKRFYSYDTETYLNELAAMCGCESIVIPNPSSKTNKNRPGVAYGLENLDYAKSTVNIMINNLKQTEEQQYDNTKLSFKKILNHFNL